jgi:hypothetical protein
MNVAKGKSEAARQIKVVMIFHFFFAAKRNTQMQYAMNSTPWIIPTILFGIPISYQYFKGMVSPSSKYEIPSRMAKILS